MGSWLSPFYCLGGRYLRWGGWEWEGKGHECEDGQGLDDPGSDPPLLDSAEGKTVSSSFDPKGENTPNVLQAFKVEFILFFPPNMFCVLSPNGFAIYQSVKVEIFVIFALSLFHLFPLVTKSCSSCAKFSFICTFLYSCYFLSS